MLFMVGSLCGNQEESLYPEMFTMETNEEWENTGKCSFRISLDETVTYRYKSYFSYKGVDLHYLNQGDTDITEHIASMQWKSKWFTLALGRGQPHLAKGLILGSTMMRMTPDLAVNAGLRAAKMGIKNGDYYKKYMSLSASHEKFYMNYFYFDSCNAGLCEYFTDNVLAGCAFYRKNTTIFETWLNYKNKNITTSFDISFHSREFNHFSSDLMFKRDNLTLYVSGVKLGQHFEAIRSDSKWGFGLQVGSFGLAGGVNCVFSLLKINAIGYRILSNNNQEERLLLECRYKKKQMQFNMAYTYKKLRSIDEDEQFPFAFNWQESVCHTLKMNMKVKISSHLDLFCQLQHDIAAPMCFVNLIRLSYKNANDMLKLQISLCHGVDGKLYFLRPLTPSYYSIRCTSNDIRNYVDLIYSKKIGGVQIYVLVRTEGVNVGMSI
jgi:hypothetical protein